MASTEIHYTVYSPETIWEEMVMAYVEAGGDILYPGDEKEILLRGAQAIIIQTLASVDAGLRMATLRYAVGEYLDIYGEKRNCERIPAAAARSRVKITFKATGAIRTIEAGTLLTADGGVVFATVDDVQQNGFAQEAEVEIICQETGSTGNGLLAGTQMQLMNPNDAISSIYVIRSATGGQDEEDDDTYRERIRTYGLASTTTGPKRQYEAAAMAVSSRILDAKAMRLSAGNVGVYLILEDDTGAAALLASVTTALNDDEVRPLTDTVTVNMAQERPYTIHAKYAAETGANIEDAIRDAVAGYQQWQDETIGQPFNPDKLMAMLYQAGAMRVVWGAGSQFDGAPLEYTPIGESERCKGQITVEVISA